MDAENRQFDIRKSVSNGRDDKEAEEISSGVPSRAGNKCSKCNALGARSPLRLCRYKNIHPTFDVESYSQAEQWQAAKIDVNKKFDLLHACWKGGEKPVFDDEHDLCPETLRHEQVYRDQMTENISSGKAARLKNIFRMQLISRLIWMTFFVHILFSWIAFTYGARIDAGEITFFQGDIRNDIVDTIGAANAILWGGVIVWFLVVFISLRVIFYWRHRRVDRVIENILRFFDQHIEQHWNNDLKLLLARLGDGDRGDVKENAALRAYHLTAVWRRLERFSARIELAWSGFRDVSGEYAPENKTITAITVLMYLLISALLINVFLDYVTLSSGVPLDVYDPFISNLMTASVVTLPSIALFWIMLRRNSLYTGDRIEAAILLLPDVEAVRERNSLKPKPISERERRFTELDPNHLLIERYRSALSDLDRLIS